MENDNVLFSLIAFTSVIVLFTSIKRVKSEAANISTIVSSYDQLIGNTPLIKLKKLSQMTGCDIFVKVLTCT
jgi:hypothetical protein